MEDEWREGTTCTETDLTFQRLKTQKNKAAKASETQRDVRVGAAKPSLTFGISEVRDRTHLRGQSSQYSTSGRLLTKPRSQTQFQLPE